jgi:hypothetical protein
MMLPVERQTSLGVRNAISYQWTIKVSLSGQLGMNALLMICEFLLQAGRLALYLRKIVSERTDGLGILAHLHRYSRVT